MPGSRLPCLGLLAALAWSSLGCDTARGQNDWQYPDPYFGVIEIEKSRPPTAERRYRAEVRQSSAHQSPPQVPRRPRWPPRRHRATGPVAGAGR